MANLDINNVVVISDIHSGCKLALCPPDGVSLDDGGTYHPSTLQKKIWGYWRAFWDDFVPEATNGEPYAVIFNGDGVDGVHHNSTTQISHNLEDQAEIAYTLLAPIVEACEGRYYHIRGTEAHVGKSAREEERLAKKLGAIPNKEGQYARYDLWKTCGPKLIHSLHHIGTTGSQAYEATALHKELVESMTEAARWGYQPPDVVVRSHRHRCIQTQMPTHNLGKRKNERFNADRAIAVVTPCWQGKTPFVWKIPGGRLSTPQFGGIVIRYDEMSGELFVRQSVWTVGRSETE